MNQTEQFVLDNVPAGVIVFNQKIEIIYRNRTADNFFKRYSPPEELTGITRRIFDAIQTSRLEELFPGEIYVYKEIEGSPSRWILKFCIREGEAPLVCVFIIEDSVSHRVNPNEMRRRFHLTRRETDVLRRVLDGLKNIDIAEDLEITEQTVKDHLSNVYMKMGVKNRFELVRSLVKLPEA